MLNVLFKRVREDIYFLSLHSQKNPLYVFTVDHRLLLKYCYSTQWYWGVEWHGKIFSEAEILAAELIYGGQKQKQEDSLDRLL